MALEGEYEPSPTKWVRDQVEKFEASNGQVFATRGVFKGEKLAVGDVPPHLSQAIIAIEDRRFREHWGIDVRGTLRAAWRKD